MKINIHAPTQLNRKLEDIIRKKVEKLDSFYPRILHAEVYLKEEPRVVKSKIVEIKLSVPGPEIFASDRSESFEKAIAGTVQKVRKQLVKYNENLTDHKSKGAPDAIE